MKTTHLTDCCYEVVLGCEFDLPGDGAGLNGLKPLDCIAVVDGRCAPGEALAGGVHLQPG